jgi:DNA invertase Pin-like site-specific DNA recombinase
MKKVIIYCRVSTEDQGDNNSPSYQENRLREYCKIMNYEVVKVVLDKKSGKNFNRPGWKEIRNTCRVKSNKIEMILFLRWDRFARNIGLAINEIEYFKKLKVELNSCEQHLDQSNPNSIVLLSMHLSMPEAERNNISLRTSECTYEAQLKGKCTHRAPKGYLNYHIDEKEKAVKIDPVLGNIVKSAFEESAKGIKSLEIIRKEVNLKGLKIGKSGFPEMLKNKFYIGQVFVRAWKGRPSTWVKGISSIN